MIDLTKSESEDDTSSKRIDLKATTDSSDDETLHQPKKVRLAPSTLQSFIDDVLQKEPKSNPSIKLATVFLVSSRVLRTGCVSSLMTVGQ